MESCDSYNCSSSALSQRFEENGARTSGFSFHSSLHEVRRPPLKPMKKPIAPLPPTKPKVYKVDSINFKQVVQRLTSAPEFQPDDGSEVDVVQTLPSGPAFRQRRLEVVAPPALDLSNTAVPPLRFLAADVGGVAATTQEAGQLRMAQIPAASFGEFITSERKLHKLSDTCGAPSPLGFSFSPSSLAWCLSPLLSPGTLSIMD